MIILSAVHKLEIALVKGGLAKIKLNLVLQVGHHLLVEWILFFVVVKPNLQTIPCNLVVSCFLHKSNTRNPFILTVHNTWAVSTDYVKHHSLPNHLKLLCISDISKIQSYLSFVSLVFEFRSDTIFKHHHSRNLV